MPTPTRAAHTINSAELLQLASGASLGTGALTVSAGTLDLGGNNQAVINFNGAAGTITSSGAGAVTLTVSPTSASAFGGALQNGVGHPFAGHERTQPADPFRHQHL